MYECDHGQFAATTCRECVTMTHDDYEEAVDTARHEGVRVGEVRGRRETLIMIHRLVDELTARDISAASQLAAIKALAKQEIWGA